MVSDSARDTAVDEDRLPWLEAVDDEDAGEGVSPAKLIALIVAALVALGIVIGGVWALRSKNAPANATDPMLIAAAEGDYKVKPETPGGMKVEGKGDSTFATSEGAEATGKIDTNALPEAPVKGIKGTAPVDPAGKASADTTIAMPKPGGRLVARTPVVVAPVRAASGTMVQLGAYGSEAKAAAAWTSLSGRFAYVAPLTHQIVTAEVGGSTVYRLRADAGAQAAAVCARLKAANENCIQVN